MLLKALHILSRGSIPILLPGYFGNETYREFLESMIRQGGQVDYDLSWISQNPLFFLLVPLLLTVLQICLSLPQLQDGEGRALRFDAFEALFLLAWFLFVPTLWALDESGKRSSLEGANLRLKVRWFQISGLMTVLALVGLWFLLALPLSFQGIQLDWLGKAMLGISILTLPHTVVVSLMDRFQLLRAH